MIRYILDAETKTIELQSSGTMEELKDLYELFKDYRFTLSSSFSPKLEKQGMVVGAQYIPILGNKIEHN